ncbi:MAG TPA: hypothetical protein PLE73_01820 [Spirochaetota bacterium]|nr:hypothetical protein [Spirochaetota bacterium]HPI21902.1 hypothetical protein [Spirochaetota bacterium]HPU87753.1 hypothetical protein [Spirochaetota bacterium]
MKPRKILKPLLLCSALLVLCAAAGAAFFLYRYPKERLGARLAAQIGDAIKRRVVVQSVEYGLNGVILRNVTIRDGMRDSDPVLASVEEARLRFSIRSLVLSLEFKVWWVLLQNAFVVLSTDGERWNIERLIDDIGGGSKSPMTASVSRVILSGCRFALAETPGPLRPLAGTYGIGGVIDIEPGAPITIRDARVRLPEGRGSCAGDLAVRREERGATLTGDVRLDNCSLGWVYRWRRRGPLPFAAVSGSITGLSVSTRAVSGAVNADVVADTGARIAVRGRCAVDIAGRRVAITQAVGTTGSSRVALEEAAFTFGGDLNRLRLGDIDADAREINRVYPLLPERIAGRVTGRLSRERGRLSGSLVLGDAAYNPEEQTVTGVNGAIVIENNVFTVRDLPVRFRGQPLRVSVASTDGNLNRLFLDISAPEFRINDMPSGDSRGPSFSGGLPFVVTGKSAIGTVFWDNLAVTGFAVSYGLEKDVLSVHHYSCRLFGGEVSGRGTVRFGRTERTVDVSVAFKNAKLQELARLSDKTRDRMFGIASGVAGLQITLPERTGARPEIRGTIVFSIVKGKFVDTGIQNGLVAILKELQYKLRDLEFERISGTIVVQGDRFVINSLTLQAPEIVVTFGGYATRSLAGDLRIELDFSRAFLKDVPNPAVWGISKYRREGRYRIPVVAKGGNITSSTNIKLAD